MAQDGLLEPIRSDNGPEFTAAAVRDWLSQLGVTTLFIEPGSPWENGCVESLNGGTRKVQLVWWVLLSCGRGITRQF